MTRAPLAVLAALAVALLALLTRRTDLVLELQDTYAGLAERMDRYSGLSRWLDWQEGVAWEQLLRNVHPPETEPGCVVASPSTFYPDYWFQWTRDSAIVMRTVVDSYISGNMTMRPLLDEYVEASYRMQHQQTLIGGIDDGGLGEVKFHVDGTPFVGEWSRPQNDGPASRATTLIRLAGHLIEMGERQSVLDTFWQGPKGGRGVIQVDLDWVAGHWREPSFDLWEEVAGSHYYTLLAIRQALALGATLATALDDSTSAARYSSQVPLLDLALEEFYSEDKGVIQVTLNHTRGRKSVENARPGDDVYGKTSALDVAVILGVLHSARDGEGTRFDDERVLLTLGRLAEEMGKTYPLNKGRKVFAIGRYPEDLYDGTGLSLAHPWFLCTLAAAEYLYLLATHHASAPFLITPRSARAHFAQFLNLPPLKQDMQVLPGSKEMRRIVKGERALGDQYLSIVREFGSRNGSLHEQFNRMSGQGEGARDLTWSYAALITAAEARRGGSRPLVVEPQRYTTVVW